MRRRESWSLRRPALRICISAPLERRRGSGERATALEALLTAVSSGSRRRRRLRRLAARSARRRVGRCAALRAGGVRRRVSSARAGQISRGAGEPARGRGRDPLVTAAARPTASIRPTSAPASRKPTRWWHPAIGRRRAPACSTRCAGSRTRARPTGAWAGWRRTAATRRRRCRAYEAAARCGAGGGRVDRLRGDRAIAAHARSTSTPPRRLRAPRRAGAAFRAGTSRPRRACIRPRTGSRTRSPSIWRRRWSTPPARARGASAGQLRADLGDDQGAIALLRRAVQLDANDGEARYALGRALLRVGRADESRQELAAFERIQKAAMEAQRRSFEENSRALESALREGAGASPAPAAPPKDAGEPARRRRSRRRVRGRRGDARAAGAVGAGTRRRRRVAAMFQDVAKAAGIAVRHTSGASAEKYLAETMGSGAAFFDFDADGWLDLFLVDGGSLADAAVAAKARHRLFRNQRDGTFADVTRAVADPHRRLRHGRVRRRRGQRRPRRSLRHELRRQRAVSQRRRRRVHRRHPRGGRGTLALEHQLRVPRHGPRRRPGSLRRQLPGRGRRRTTASAATRSAGFASTAIP